MILDYVPESLLEAFVVRTHSEISMDDFVKMISEHRKLFPGKLNWKRIEENGSGIVYILQSETNQPILELMQIGSEKVRYFSVDKADSVKSDSPESRGFKDFHEFLRRIVKTNAPLDYSI